MPTTNKMNSNTTITKMAMAKATRPTVKAIPLPSEGIVPLVAMAMTEKINDANPTTAIIGIITASRLATRQNFLPDSNDKVNPLNSYCIVIGISFSIYRLSQNLGSLQVSGVLKLLFAVGEMSLIKRGKAPFFRRSLY